MNNVRHLVLLAVGFSSAALGLAGCVERRLVIASDPPGALLLLNDREVGRTPISVPIEWDGDYDVRLRHEKDVGTPGNPNIVRYYLHTHRQTVTPWYQIIPLDLVAELLPVNIKDEQVWAFIIPEMTQPQDADVIRRAQALKAQITTPAPDAAGGK